jgi:anti-sigma factor RsiW
MNAVINYFKCLFRMRSCQNVHKLLFDYVQGNLAPEKQQKLTEHLRDCPLCMEYVKTYKLTIEACHKCCRPKAEMPPELREKLEEFINKL